MHYPYPVQTFTKTINQNIKTAACKGDSWCVPGRQIFPTFGLIRSSEKLPEVKISGWEIGEIQQPQDCKSNMAAPCINLK